MSHQLPRHARTGRPVTSSSYSELAGVRFDDQWDSSVATAEAPRPAAKSTTKATRRRLYGWKITQDGALMGVVAFLVVWGSTVVVLFAILLGSPRFSA